MGSDHPVVPGTVPEPGEVVFDEVDKPLPVSQESPSEVLARAEELKRRSLERAQQAKGEAEDDESEGFGSEDADQGSAA